MKDGRVRWLDREQQAVWRDYLAAHAQLFVKITADLARRGLDIPEYEVLVVLSEAPQWSVRMSELAVAVHQSRSRLTHTVTRMEKRGLLVRESVESDRRGVMARLTQAGFDLLDEAAPDHVATVRRYLVDAMPAEDFAVLGRALRAILAATGQPR